MRKKRLRVLFIVIMMVFLIGCGSIKEENTSNQAVAEVVNNSPVAVKIDPFEYVTIEYDGDSYSGTIKKINNNATDTFMSGLTFSADKDYGLANGDIITVSIQYLSTATEQASELNYVFKQTEKEYVVEGLPYYIYSLSEIPDDLMEEMKIVSDEKMVDFLSNNILIISNEEIINRESEYVGNLLWTFKSISGAYANHCYFVYKIHIKTPIDEFDYYYYIEFYDLYMDIDGTVTLQVDYTGQPNGTMGEYFEHGEKIYEGFESIEDMINSWYEQRGDNWTLDSNITE